MAYSNIKATLSARVKRVWDIVTDLDDWSWRSDLERIERISGTEFVEYSKDGHETRFTVTLSEPYERWEFDMENDNFKGHWTGIFYDQGKKTTIDFTEKVTVKKFYLKPFAGRYLRKQQRQYFDDLLAKVRGAEE